MIRTMKMTVIKRGSHLPSVHFLVGNAIPHSDPRFSLLQPCETIVVIVTSFRFAEEETKLRG